MTIISENDLYQIKESKNVMRKYVDCNGKIYIIPECRSADENMKLMKAEYLESFEATSVDIIRRFGNSELSELNEDPIDISEFLNT